MRACTSSKMSEEKSSPSCNKEELSKIKYKNVKFNYNVYKTNILLSYYSPNKVQRIHFWQTRQILYGYQQSSVVFKFCKPLLATLNIRGKKTESNCRNELQQKQSYSETNNAKRSMPQGSELGSVLLFLLTNKKCMQTTQFLLYHKNQRKQILTRYLNQTKQFCSDYVNVVHLVSIKQFSDTNTSQTWGSSAEWATKLDVPAMLAKISTNFITV